MSVRHLLDSVHTGIAIAAGSGSFVTLMLTRRMGWVHVLVLFFVGQTTAYFFTVPVADWWGWSMNSYGALGFLIGAFAMAFWGAGVSLFESFREDPRGTITWLWGLWRNGGGNRGPDSGYRDPKDGGIP